MNLSCREAGHAGLPERGHKGRREKGSQCSFCCGPVGQQCQPLERRARCGVAEQRGTPPAPLLVFPLISHGHLQRKITATSLPLSTSHTVSL